MNKFTTFLATCMLVTLGLAPQAGIANPDEACGTTAKSIFSNGGSLQSDGGRQAPPAQAAGSPVSAKDKPALHTCRPRTTLTTVGAAATVASPLRVEPHSGLALWVETLSCGSATSRRTTDYRFVTGDCAKLFFMPNTEGYLYVSNVDTTNKVDYLFPERGENNLLRAGEDANFGVEFVGSPGIERIFVFFSKTKIVDVPGLTLKVAERVANGRSIEQGYSVLLANAGGQTNTSKSLRRTDEVVSTSTPDAARYVVIADSELASMPIMVMSLDLVHASR